MTDALRDRVEWQLIADILPNAKQEVLLCWTWPDTPDAPIIYRIGELPWRPFLDDKPIWLFRLDCGDASAMIYSQKDDDQPTHWKVIDAPPDHRCRMRPLISSKARFALNNPAGRDHITLTRSEAVTIALVLVALPLWIVAGWL